jgi:hypothetical protein
LRAERLRMDFDRGAERERQMRFLIERAVLQQRLNLRVDGIRACECLGVTALSQFHTGSAGCIVQGFGRERHEQEKEERGIHS